MTDELTVAVAEGLRILAQEAHAAYDAVREKAWLELASLSVDCNKSAKYFQELYLESLRLWDIYEKAACEAIDAWENMPD